MRSNRAKRVSLIGVVFLLAAVAVVLAVPPANRYEISLYRAYPAYFWVFVIGALFSGALTIILSANSEGRSWVVGLLTMLLTDAMLLLMPFVRGYQMYGRGDELSHLGFVQDILNMAGIGGNIYPPTHLLVVILTAATGSDPMQIAMMIPAIFSGLYFGAMFYLLVSLFDSRQRILFGLPFAVLPVIRYAHLGIRPFDLSVLLAPLVLYLFVKGQRHPSSSIRVTLVISLVALLLYHPLTAVFVTGVFLIYFLARYAPAVREQYAAPTNILSLSAAVLVGWYSHFTGIILRFDRFYETLFGIREGEAPVEAYVQTVERASPTLIDLIRVMTFKFGIEFVLFGLGFAFLGLSLLSTVREEDAMDSYTVMLGGTLGLFSIGGLAFLVTDLIVTPRRLFQIAKIGAVVLTGQLFYLLWARVDWPRHRPRFRKGVYVTLVVVLLAVVVLTTFSIYKSPLASEKNHQVTQMEIEGSEWLTEHGTAADGYSEFGVRYWRLYDAQQGTETPMALSLRPLPDHFNYTSHEYLGQSYTNDTYVIITRRGRIVYPEVFPNYPANWRFTPTDYRRLEKDRTTTRTYDNGDLTLYLAEGRDDMASPG